MDRRRHYPNYARTPPEAKVPYGLITSSGMPLMRIDIDACGGAHYCQRAI
ncbi:hypothetical protein VCR6J2_230443 [Vibrio coralliirubri]|nr:hypothetical protein VCR6J2_230443 [Vibrio coralliirubri]